VKYLRDRLLRILPEKPGRLGTFIAYLGAGLATFILGLILFFPATPLKLRLQTELARKAAAQITIDDLAIRPLFSLVGSGIAIRMNDPAIPELQFDSLTLTPHLATLTGRPGVDFDARTAEGRIEGSISRDGAFQLGVDQYRFEAPLRGLADVRLTGTISGARVDAHLDPEAGKPAHIELQAAGLVLSGTGSLGLAVDRINLGQLSLVADGEGRTLTITQATCSGGDILAEASGSVVVGRNVQTTRLNIALRIRPAASLDPSVASLFELLGAPDTDGSHKLNIRGTLARPTLR